MWSLCLLFIFCLGDTGALDIEMGVYPPVAALGEETDLSLMIDPKQNTMCIVYIEPDNCSHIFLPDELVVMMTATMQGGSTGYYLRQLGHYKITLQCENNGTIEEVSQKTKAEERITGLDSSETPDTPLIIRVKRRQFKEVLVNFTYIKGSDAMGSYQLNGEAHNSSRFVIDQLARSGYLILQDETSLTSVPHTLEITVSNQISSQHINVTILPIEEIDDLSFVEMESVLLINSTRDMEVNVMWGTNLSYVWAVNNIENTISRNSSLTYQFDKHGLFNITLSVSNFWDTKHISTTVNVVKPVAGFNASFIGSGYNDIILHSPRESHFPMGNLSVKLTWGSLNYQTIYLSATPASDTIIKSTLSRQSETLQISVYSDLSQQQLFLNIPGSPINIDIQFSQNPILTGKEVEIILTNSTGPGFFYVIDFGDGESLTESQNGFISREIRRSHIYSLPGSYSVKIQASNSIFSTNVSRVIYVQNPIATFELEATSTVLLPPGIATFYLSVSTSTLSPTNATCELDFEDKTGTLSLNWEDINNSIQTHEYKASGEYNVHLVCQNSVSNKERSQMVKVLDFFVENFTVEYNKVVPLNSSKNAAHVLFTMGLFELAVPPPAVTVTWNFGDSTDPERNLLSSWTQTHEFTSRGVFDLYLNVSTGYHEGLLGPYTIVIGMFTVEIGKSYGTAANDRFTVLVHSHFNGEAHFKVDFRNGQIAEETISNNFPGFVYQASAIYSVAGVYTPRIVVWNNDYTEEQFAEESFNVLWSISDMLITMSPKVIGHSGTSYISVELKGPNNPTNVSCHADIGDGTRLNEIPYRWNVSSAISIGHTFTAVGKISVSVICSNLATSIKKTTYVSVVNNCYGLSQAFETIENPLRKMVCQQLTLTASLHLQCTNMTAEFYWNVDKISNGTELKVDVVQPNITVLVLSPRSMVPGTYRITVYANFRDLPSSFSTDQVTVIYQECSLRARIAGGKLKRVSVSMPVIVDALSFSKDPDDPLDSHPNQLVFDWQYNVLESQSAVDLVLGGMEVPPCNSCLDMVLGRQGVLIFTPGFLSADLWHVFTVNVSKPTKHALYTQIIHIVRDEQPQINIRCKVNCDDKINAEFSFGLETECLDCSSSEVREATYKWRLSEKGEEKFGFLADFDLMTSTGTKISTMSIKPNTLRPGSVYNLELEVGEFKTRRAALVALTFTVNYPPYNGTCVINPTTGYAAIDSFGLSCEGWKDEDESEKRSEQDSDRYLHYEFLLSGYREQRIIYSGESRRSPAVQLPPGREENGYQVTITARIFDIYRGMTETNITVQVIPPLDRHSVVTNLTEVQRVMGKLDLRFDQALMTGDIKQVARVTDSSAAVLNRLLLPGENSSLPDDPETWISPMPADLRNGNGTATPWKELWGDLLSPTHSDVKTRISNTNTKQVKGLSDTLQKTSVTSSDVVHFVAGSLITVTENPSRVREETMVHTGTILKVLADPLSSLIHQDMSDTHEGTVLNTLVNSVMGVLDAALPYESIPSDVGSFREALGKIEKIRFYKKSSESTLDNLEDSDLQDEERAFLYIRKSKEQKYSYNRRKKVAKSLFDTLDRSVDQILDASSVFLVSGQKSAVFENPKGSVAVQRNILVHLINNSFEVNGITMQSQSMDTFDVDTTTQIKLKISIVDKKLNLQECTSHIEALTSPTVKVSLEREDFWDGDTLLNTNMTLTQKVTIPNPVPVTFHRTVPKFIPLDRDQLLYHRLELSSPRLAIVIYIKPDVNNIQYEVYFKLERFPTATDFGYKTMTRPFQNGTLKAVCPRRTFTVSGTVYIGLKPIPLDLKPLKAEDELVDNGEVYQPMLESSSNFSQVRGTSFNIGIAAEQCHSWLDNNYTDNEYDCEISDNSDLEASTCICDQPLMSVLNVAHSFLAPVNTIDFSTVFAKIDLQNNSSVFACVVTLFVVYTFLAVWARRKDQQDVLKWGVTSLADNFKKDKYLYLMTVYTGMRIGAGTKSKIGFVVVGDDADTGVRKLHDGIRNETPSRSVMHFVMAVPSTLGHIQYMRIWHDNSGSGRNASWFLYKVVLEDIQRDRRYTFQCNRWLAVDQDDGLIERLLPVSAKQELVTFSGLFYNNTRKNFTDSHLWFSVLLRPQRSPFTRLQRLSCCLCLLFLTMISNALFYLSEENVVNPTVVHMGIFRFSLEQLYVSVASLLMVMPINVLIVWLFKQSKPGWHPVKSSPNVDCLSCATSRLLQSSENDKKLLNALVARGFHSPKQKQLPHCCVYVAWAVVFLSVSLSAFFLFLYSQQWGKTKAEEWLTSFLLSFFESLFVIDPIKVLVIAALLALFIRKPEDSASDGFDKNEIKTNQSMSVGIEGGEREAMEPLAGEDLKAAQTSRKKETKSFGVLREIILYIIFLFIVYTIGYSNRDPRSFWLQDNMSKMMINPQSSIGLSKVKTTEMFYKWVNETVFPTLFQPTYYQGSRRRWWERYYVRDLQNYRVGPPRMRQVRSPSMSMCYEKLMGEMPCNSRYYMYHQERRDFCIRWKHPPCREEDEVFKFSNEAWKFQSFADSLSIPLFGYYNTYSGGGYIAELDVNLDVSTKILEELFSELWVDRQTRAVIIEYTTFNANTNLFCYVNLMAEFPETGGVLTYQLIRPFRIYQHTGALGAYIFINEIIFLVVVCFAFVKVVLRIRRQKFKYFHDSWHLNEFFCLLTCLVAIAIYIVREVVSRETMSNFRKDPKNYVSFYHITIWDEVLVNVIGLLSFICTVRMIRVLGYSKRSASMMDVLKLAKVDLFHYSFMFLLMFVAYATVAFIIFGSAIADYRDMLVTAATLITTMIGRSPFDHMKTMEPIFAPLFFGSFIFFEVFIMLTMFLAILDESIATVRGDEEIDNFKQHDMVDVLIGKFKDTIGIFLPAKLKKYLTELAKDPPVQMTEPSPPAEDATDQPKTDILKTARDVLYLQKALESGESKKTGED